MSELGYYEQIQGGIYGTPDNAQSPEAIAALQEATTQAMIQIAETAPGYVPQSYQGHQGASPGLQQVGGPSNLPIRGWTAQNATGPAFIEPYVATDMGRIPDWTSDPNSIGAGRYDQNEAVAYGDYNPLNRGPLGDGVLQGMDGEPPNPNSAPMDNGSLAQDLEY